MLTANQHLFLQIIRNSFNKETVLPADTYDLMTVSNIIIRNGVLLTIYQNLPIELKNILNSQYHAAVKQSIVQNHEGDRVLKSLSDAGFSCIALKGWELRNFYPDIIMRQMADLDILIKPFEYKEIKRLLEGLGYSGGAESSWKHISFNKNEVNLEMHRRLTDDSGLIQDWERSIWNRVSLVKDNIYKMSPEDFYIFHFIHLHKDFLNGSLGLRRIIDTWLLSKQTVDIDFVKNKLSEFNMLKFHDSMIHLSRVTMGEERLDEDSEFMLKYAFAHGIYGNGKSYKVGRIAAMGDSMESGKRKSLFSAVFLPYPRMKAQFPILVKHPYLLPVCWIKRIFQLSKNRKKYKGRLSYNDVSQEDFDEMKRLFRAGGVIT